MDNGGKNFLEKNDLLCELKENSLTLPSSIVDNFFAQMDYGDGGRVCFKDFEYLILLRD